MSCDGLVITPCMMFFEGGHLVAVARSEWMLPGAQLVQADPQAEDVSPTIEVPLGDLLRGHVAELALEGAGLGLCQPSARPGHAEIEQLGGAFPGHHDVARGDVPVHQPQWLAVGIERVVGVVERVGDTSDDRRGVAVVDLVLPVRLPDDHAESDALDVLHGHERNAVLLADLEHLDDVRVVQVGHHPRLVQEHLDEVRIARALRDDALEHDLFVEAANTLEAADIHVRHAAAA